MGFGKLLRAPDGRGGTQLLPICAPTEMGHRPRRWSRDVEMWHLGTTVGGHGGGGLGLELRILEVLSNRNDSAIL